MTLDLNLILGVIGGLIGIAAYIKTARLDALKGEIARLTGRVQELELKLRIVQTERDAARDELTKHLTARIEIADENRELHKENRELHKELLNISRAA
jgi:septal ring factor EnvC (AmiA/AmiB activator)